MKKTPAVLGLAIAASLLISACSTSNKSAKSDIGSEISSDTVSDTSSVSNDTSSDIEEAYHKITAEEAKEMIDEGDVILIDVRTREEYDSEHIPGATLISLETIGGEPPLELPDKEAVLLIYCRTGRRSKEAADKLVELGYTNVYDFGGIVDWPYQTGTNNLG